MVATFLYICTVTFNTCTLHSANFLPCSLVDPPRPEPSSSGMAISPLVAIITGALSALFLLAVILVVALRMRCRRSHSRAASLERSRSSDVDRFLTHDGGPSAGSETLLLAKTERCSTPLFNPEVDDRNPDLIPHQNGTFPFSIRFPYY